MSRSEFAGVRPVLHVPFDGSLEQGVRHDELRSLARLMLESDVDGLVALGLASEAWTLTERERNEVLEAVADATTGHCPFVVGIEGTTALAIERARQAVTVGASGLMVLPPAAAGSTDRLVSHYARLADAAGVPILVQDSPQVTGVTLDLRTLLTLAGTHPLVRSVKIEIPAAGEKVSALAAAGVEVVAGWGGLHYLESVRRGASGCMPGCDLGPALVAIDRMARSGNDQEAYMLYSRILPLLSYEAQSLDLLLLGAKRHLRRLGVFTSDALRAPGRSLDDHEAATIDEMLALLAEAGIPGFGAVRAKETVVQQMPQNHTEGA